MALFGTLGESKAGFIVFERPEDRGKHEVEIGNQKCFPYYLARY